MTTKVKSSATSRKGRNVSENVNVSNMVQVINAASSIAAPAGIGVTAGGASAGSRSAAVGGAAPAKVRNSFNAQLSAAVVREDDVKLLAFRSKIASNWAAPEWSGAAALRGVLAGSGLSEEQINAAVAAAGRKSGECLDAVTPTINDVCEYIRTNYSKEFETLCGCAVPAASAVRCYSYSPLSVSTITADSDINDYIITSAVPAGASASAVVAAVLSVRVLVDIRRRIAAARSAARNDLKSAAAALVRRAGRLGVSSAVLGRYLRLLAVAVPAADNKERERLATNLARCGASLRNIENNIVLSSPAGLFGAAAPIADDFGGWCFPASLPASAPAKIRKLWAKRVRLLSSVSTLETLLKRCA